MCLADLPLTSAKCFLDMQAGREAAADAEDKTESLAGAADRLRGSVAAEMQLLQG